MTDFTNIRTALNQLITSIEGICSEIRTTANEQRRELIALTARMNDTRKDLGTLADITDEAACTLADISDLCAETHDKIGDVLAGEEIPECDYEDFIGYCDSCGAPISVNDKYHELGGYLDCADCVPFEEDENEPEDEGDFAPLAETVTPAEETVETETTAEQQTFF